MRGFVGASGHWGMSRKLIAASVKKFHPISNNFTDMFARGCERHYYRSEEILLGFSKEIQGGSPWFVVRTGPE